MTEKKPTLEYGKPPRSKRLRWHWWYIVALLLAGYLAWWALQTLALLHRD